MNEVGIVVSRYYEDLTWIHDIKAPVDVYVYNRVGESPGMGSFGVDGQTAVSWAKPKDHNDTLGGLNIELCKQNGINLEIIEIADDPGFEAGTYAYHCYHKHDKLNDYTMFVQGHPSIYVKNCIEVFNNPELVKHTEYVRTTNEDYSPVTTQHTDLLIDFQPFCDHMGTVKPNGEYIWSLWWNNYNNAPWLEFCKDMPGSWIDDEGNWYPPAQWHFGGGNQFIVRKDLILKHDQEYYKRIHTFANTFMDPRGDSRPHWQQLNQGPNVMEGIWKFVF